MGSHACDRARTGRWKAAIAAMVVILAGDAGYRLASARYAQLASSTPIPEGSLELIPLNIEGWVGEDVPLDPNIVKYTDTDDRLQRRYVRGLSEVTLYLAYGVRIRDLAPHRPEVCYIGAGWTRERSKEVEVGTAQGRLPVQIQTFRRGEFDQERVTVLSYYLVNGLQSADVSGLRREVWRLDHREPYSVQIQVVAGGASDDAERLVKTFASESASVVRSVIARAVDRQGHSRPAGVS